MKINVKVVLLVLLVLVLLLLLLVLLTAPPDTAHNFLRLSPIGMKVGR